MATKSQLKKNYEPTTFQRAILKLSLKEFREKTNICEIVENGYRKAAEEKKVPFAEINTELMSRYTKHFHDRLYKVHAWHKSDLKYLKWKTAATRSRKSPTKTVATASTSRIASTGNVGGHVGNGKKRKSSEMQDNSADNEMCLNDADASEKRLKREIAVTMASGSAMMKKEVKTKVFEAKTFECDRLTIFEPSDFQAEVISLNYDEFVAQTNIEDIARRETQLRSEKTNRPVTAAKIDVRVKQYYGMRDRIDEWWTCGLKNLKFKLCECKRNLNHTVVDAMIQTDVLAQHDADTQCDFDSEFFTQQSDEQAVLASQSTQTDPPDDALSVETVAEKVPYTTQCVSDSGFIAQESGKQIVLASQSTQTDPPNDALSEESVAQKVPYAVHVQQTVELMILDTANGINDAPSEYFATPKEEMLTEDAEILNAIQDSDAIDDDVEKLIDVTVELAEQLVEITDTNELNTGNMFRDMMARSINVTDFNDESIELSAMEMERGMREAMHKGEELVLELNPIGVEVTETTSDVENIDSSCGQMDDDSEMVLPFSESDAVELCNLIEKIDDDQLGDQADDQADDQAGDHVTDQEDSQVVDQADNLVEIDDKAIVVEEVDNSGNISNSNPAYANTLAAEECDEHATIAVAPFDMDNEEVDNSGDVSNSNPAYANTLAAEECDEHATIPLAPLDVNNGELPKEPLCGMESSDPSKLSFTPSDSTQDVVNSSERLEISEKTNLSDGDFDVAEPPAKKSKLIQVEHGYAAYGSSLLHSGVGNASETKELVKTIVFMQQSSPWTIEPEMCAVRSRQAEFKTIILKTPQCVYHDFLYHFNIECTSRRLTADTRTATMAANNCQEQMKLQKALGLNEKCEHFIKLYGKNPRKLCQLKCHSWKDVQVLLQIVKNFTYSARVLEPPAKSIVGRTLFQFFVKTSKFTNVHIRNVQKDGKELSTAYNLKPNRKCGRSAIDPFFLDTAFYDSKNLKVE